MYPFLTGLCIGVVLHYGHDGVARQYRWHRKREHMQEKQEAEFTHHREKLKRGSEYRGEQEGLNQRYMKWEAIAERQEKEIRKHERAYQSL